MLSEQTRKLIESRVTGLRLSYDERIGGAEVAENVAGEYRRDADEIRAEIAELEADLRADDEVRRIAEARQREIMLADS